ncbi:23S rRNA (guanosine(2251)-2'-O)-methyltransferase RlmB [Rhodoluna lacicola]|uniref:rRNA methylase, putative, group 3 n=1 Tax=Rhodoluna lacicola TaxID=529884 RepID=A0A060JBI0_9MICO|nr:23S rRNA (guanosine(2251)-2'-O)-methyltransferase RlmB [Rhodoluna lacicola]AIC47196.1 rRNA methylase, putative, group 3 [Rhodoluna lacicola]
MAGKPGRPGAAKSKKGGKVGSGGNNKQRLEGRGPTPKAEDRKNHKAFKAKQAAERKAAALGIKIVGKGAGNSSTARKFASELDPKIASARTGKAAPRAAAGRAGAASGRAGTSGAARGTAGTRDGARRGEFLAPGQRTAGAAGAAKRAGQRVAKAENASEVLSGRNSVLEALRSKVPATALFIATRIEMDERVKEAIKIAAARGVPVTELTRPEIDRMTGFDSVHQGIALQVPPYKYQHPMELLDLILSRGQKPLLVALDGITDPRNLGAIIRSVAAFGGQGVILPQRRSTGVTASAWKTSAGAAARIPVALAANLNATLKDLKKRGCFIVGLDGGGDMSLPEFSLGTEPLVLVVGSEGKGLSRLVTENCDAVVSIPITGDTESLNAGIAASVTLYEVSKRRAAIAKGKK